MPPTGHSKRIGEAMARRMNDSVSDAEREQPCSTPLKEWDPGLEGINADP